MERDNSLLFNFDLDEIANPTDRYMVNMGQALAAFDFEVVKAQETEDELNTSTDQLVNSICGEVPIIDSLITRPYQEFLHNARVIQSRIVVEVTDSNTIYLLVLVDSKEAEIAGKNVVAAFVSPNDRKDNSSVDRVAADINDPESPSEQEVKDAVLQELSFAMKMLGSESSGEIASLDIVELESSFPPLFRKSYNSLVRGGIRTVEDLCSKTRRDLRKIPKFGEAALLNVEVALAGMGLHLEAPNSREEKRYLALETAVAKHTAQVKERVASDQLDQIGLRDLYMTTAVMNALLRRDIKTVDQLISKSEEELRQIDIIGRSALDEIYNVLGHLGLSLAQ